MIQLKKQTQKEKSTHKNRNIYKNRKDEKKRWLKYTEILNQEDMCITRKRRKKLLQQKDYRKDTKFSRKMRIVIKMRKIS